MLCDFCSKIGLEIDRSKTVVANESLSLEAIAMMYVYYNFTKKHTSFDTQPLYKLMKNIGTQKLRLCGGITKELARQNREDLDWIEEKMGVSMDDTNDSDREGCIESENQLVEVALMNHALLEPLLPERLRKKSDKVFLEQLVQNIDYLLQKERMANL